MTTIEETLASIGSVIWGPWLLIPLLLGTGLYLTIRLGGIQFVRLIAALRLGILRRRDPDADGDISQFQALTTALAATVGTGNIVGVATAIGVGGPGSLFWMWITGLVGMASKYSEAYLGVRFRTTDSAGERNGGPQQYLERGIRGPLGKLLAGLFTVFTIFACFGIGNMTQGNSVAVNVRESTSIPTWVTGLVLTVIALAVLVGGIKSIGRVTAGLVPVMILFYVLAALFILVANIGELPHAVATIVTDAFTGTAAAGGFAGSVIIVAVQMGVARGIFSNESGMGSAAIAASAAQTSHPVRQGLVSMTQTFIDTIIVVSMTGLVIIVTDAYTFVGDDGDQMSAALMTSEAFTDGLPGSWGHWIVTIGISLFAFSTLLGWSYYGERNMEKVFGRASVIPFRIVFSLIVYVGCVTELTVVWNFSDVMNGLMALPNLIGLLILSGLVARETRAYLRHDPKLVATTAEVEAFMADDPGYREWRRTEVPAAAEK
ncbi:alanine/glycine:cation symporter family protein [Gordonia shandongensis]|uniref:alanine/glycine:cation symporter family protein n=1 Tax=Gordonia shandongensis TaxID=376351 RepID=UPI001B7FCA14